ncbi:MAG: HEAT repeat domain-containing protein [Spirochaetaceae bacterium]|jgi:HEAT repeat protein|nr:HEAT repeat domain-containing protein [Spirochaetaceae bacterium]
MKTVYFAFLLFLAAAFFLAGETPEEDAVSAEETRLREIIKYGTDNEISDLIKKLRADKIESLDEDILTLAKKTKNQNIILGVFSFFNERAKSGLEETAMTILEDRESETPQKISAALDYLGALKDKKALPVITDIISSDDSRFDNAAIRALGKIVYSGTDAETGSSGAPADELNSPPSAESHDTASAGTDTSAESDLSADNNLSAEVGLSPEGDLSGPPDTAPEESGGMAKITEILIDYYNNRNPSEDNRQAIISAIGGSGGEAAVPFLLEIINDNEQSTPIRMSALESAGKLKDAAALDSIFASAGSGDPNIRFAAITALGYFDGEAVDKAILEGFRDTYFKTRLAAVRSAKKRRLKEAIPYLRYRAEKDEAAAVKEEAVSALGAFNNEEADKAVLAIFNDAKNGDSLRSLCAVTLIKNNADAYAENIIAKLDEAKAKKQTALYKGLLKALGSAKTAKVETLTARLFASNDVVEKFYALDMTANNRFTAFKSEVEKLTQEKNASLARRAKTTLDKLG